MDAAGGGVPWLGGRADRWPTIWIMAIPEQRSAAAANEVVRRRRLREDARRGLSANLAETIALSHELIRMAEAAKRG